MTDPRFLHFSACGSSLYGICGFCCHQIHLSFYVQAHTHPVGVYSDDNSRCQDLPTEELEEDLAFTACARCHAVIHYIYTPSRWVGKEERSMPMRADKQEVLKRLNYIEGHLGGIRKMIEEDKYCVDILRQTYAVRKAIEKLEGLLAESHLHTCVPEGIASGKSETVIEELVQLYNLAGNR